MSEYSFKIRLRALAVLWIVFCVSCVVYLQQISFGAGRIETDVLKLLPQSSRNQLVNEAVEQFARRSSGKIVVLLSANSLDEAKRGLASLAEQLGRRAVFRRIQARWDTEPAKMLADFYRDKRAYLVPETAQLELLDEKSVETLLERIQLTLSSPFSGSFGLNILEDPLLLYPFFLAQLDNPSGGMSFDDGYLIGEKDGHPFSLLFAELNGGAFSRDIQRDVSAALEESVASLRETCSSCKVATTGVLKYAKYAADQAEREIAFISIGSLFGVTLLIWIMFHSVVPLLVMFLTIFVSTLAAYASTIFFFGEIHMITLGFGASLVGVGVDHGFHFYCHQAYEKGESPFALLRQILPSITLGILTTILGYLGLLAAPFPGLNQIAWFSIIGLSAGYITVVLWYPFLPPVKRRSGEPLLLRLIRAWLGLWRRRSPLLWPLWIAVGIFLVYGLSHARISDDVRLLQDRPVELIAEDRFIENATGHEEQSRFFLISASRAEDVLEKNAVLTAKLRELKDEGVLQGFDSLSNFVPPDSLQRKSALAVRNFVSLHESELRSRLADLGLEQTTLDSTLARLKEDPIVPFSLEAWLGADVSFPYRHLWLGEISGKYASILTLRGASDVAKLSSLSEPGVFYIDEVDDASRLLGEYRRHVSIVVPLLYFFVFLFMIWRYGFLRGGVAFLPAGVAALLCIAMQGITGEPINLFSLLAILIVLGLGIDYTIFLLEGEEQVEATMMAVVFSAVSTFLSLALLALCSAPVLRVFGESLLIGTAFAMLWSPIVLYGRSDEIS